MSVDAFNPSLAQATSGSAFRMFHSASFRYYAGIFLAIWLAIAAVMLTVEAIFLSDIIVSLILPELLALDAGAGTILAVILYSAPSGIFIALPLAIVVGVYFVLLRRREDQEFVVTAGLSHGSKPLFAIAFGVGFIGAALSFFVSGFVEPLARYEFRSVIAAAAQQAVRDGKLSAGKFYSVGNTTLFATDGNLSDVAENVFIHTQEAPEEHRVILARKTQNPQITEQGQIGLVFNHAHVYEFRKQSKETCDGCEASDRLYSEDHFFISNFYSQLPPLELLEPRQRGGEKEATIAELISLSNPTKEQVRVIGERTMRWLLCIIAPFIAMAAVAMTFRASLPFAMPAACAAILSLSFFNTTLIGQLSHLGVQTTVLSLLAISALILALCMVFIQKNWARLSRSAGLGF